MKTYGQFCPVAKAAEIFAERWTPLIIRELLMGSKKFGWRSVWPTYPGLY